MSKCYRLILNLLLSPCFVWASMNAQAAGYIKKLSELQHGDEIQSIAESPDGKRAVTGNRKKVIVWDTANGSMVWSRQTEKGSFDLPYYGEFIFSPDNKLLAIQQEHDAALYRVADGRHLATLIGARLRVSNFAKHQFNVPVAMAFSADSRWLFTNTRKITNFKAGEEGLSVFATNGLEPRRWFDRLWKRYFGKPELRPPTFSVLSAPRTTAQGREEPTAIAESVFLTNGTGVVLRSESAIQVFSLPDGKESARYTRLPDGERPGDDFRDQVMSVNALSPRGAHVAYCSLHSLSLFPTARPNRPIELETNIPLPRGSTDWGRKNCEFSPDGNRIVMWWNEPDDSSKFFFTVWNTSGERLMQFDLAHWQNRTSTDDTIQEMLWSGDSRRLITVSDKKTIGVFTIDKDEYTAFRDRPGKGKGGSTIATDYTGMILMTNHDPSFDRAQLWQVLPTFPSK